MVQGKNGCSIRDVASRAGVAASTVSRVLTGRLGNLHVAPATRERILAAARELNYTPNINARRLFSHQSKVIALVLPALKKCGYHVFADRHFIEFFPGIEDALSQTDYRLLIVFNDERFVANRDYLGLFREHAIDGMLVWGAREEEEFWAEADAAKLPVVFLSNPSRPYRKLGFLLHDYATGAQLALEHLLARNHRQIGWIGGYRNNGSTAQCEAGFRQVLEAHPEITLQREYGNFSASGAVDCAEKLLNQYPELTALMISNASAAEGVWRYLQEKGVRVPEQVALVACDGLKEVEKSDVSRVVVDDFQMGNQSVLQLIRWLDGKSDPVAKRLEVHFQPGRTT